MRQSALLVAGSLASLSLAAPLEGRAVTAPAGGDDTILNYALTLEYLERKFYQEGIANFTEAQFCQAGFDALFYSNLLRIYSDEMTHVEFLLGALGDKAIKEPSFAYPFTDVKSFVGLASVLEGVGVSAYLGAAAAIADKTYLTAAGSILVVESRHSSFIRSYLGESPFPNPFDTPLDFNQVYSMASQFITALAPGTSLPFKAFPPLTVVSQIDCAYKAGGGLIFKGAYKNAEDAGMVKDGAKVYAVFFSGLQTYYVAVTVSGSDYLADIPMASNGKPAPSGQVYVLLSTADGKNTMSDDSNTISGVGLLEVY